MITNLIYQSVPIAAWLHFVVPHTRRYVALFSLVRNCFWSPSWPPRSACWGRGRKGHYVHGLHIIFAFFNPSARYFCELSAPDTKEGCRLIGRNRRCSEPRECVRFKRIISGAVFPSAAVLWRFEGGGSGGVRDMVNKYGRPRGRIHKSRAPPFFIWFLSSWKWTFNECMGDHYTILYIL